MTEDTQTPETPETSAAPSEPAPEFGIRVVQNQLSSLKGRLQAREKTVSELGRVNAALVARLDALERESTAAKSARIEREIAEAARSEDYTKVAALTSELASTKSKGAQTAPLPAATEAQSGTSQQADADQAPVDPDTILSPADQAKALAWAEEKGTDQQPLRPWLREGHPKYQRAALTIRAAMADGDLKAKGIEAVMAEVDRAMGVRSAPRAAGAGALTSDGSPGSSRPAVKLSADQREAARAMGLSEDKYREVLAKSVTDSSGRLVARWSAPDDKPRKRR